MTKAVGQHVWGQLLWENPAAQDGRLALLLTNPKPEEESDASLILRFAFVTVGPEEHLFPSFLIDDWGGEVRSLALYGWVHENGNQFPRQKFLALSKTARRCSSLCESWSCIPNCPATFTPTGKRHWLRAGKLAPFCCRTAPSASQKKQNGRLR